MNTQLIIRTTLEAQKIGFLAEIAKIDTKLIIWGVEI